MYWSTFILYGPTLIVFVIDGDSTRCFLCQKFGHGKQSCRGHAKCYRCSEEGHDGLTCDKPVKCSNCNLDHMSSSKEYPVYLKEREIQKIKIEKSISYLDARRQVSISNDSSQNSKASYASAAKRNHSRLRPVYEHLSN